ncbi:MAG TPA: hypothetical protein VM308_03300 [Sphingomicrobium sp.]|nr:hypothetical protein [Sphingomicrobium sp.]
MFGSRVPAFCCAAVLALVACDQRAPVAPEANTGVLPATDEQAPSVAGEPRGDVTTPATSAPAAAVAIPASLHGRWGLTPADCEPRPDNKGLLSISGNELRFYESVAVPTANVQVAANSISGSFRFAGEGQTWTKFQALKLQGPVLVRTETNPAASFSYAKCD